MENNAPKTLSYYLDILQKFINDLEDENATLKELVKKQQQIINSLTNEE